MGSNFEDNREHYEKGATVAEGVRAIDQELLARVMDNFRRKIENRIQHDGHHLSDIIFHT